VGAAPVTVAFGGLIATAGTERFTGMVVIALITLSIAAFLIVRVARRGVYVQGTGLRIVMSGVPMTLPLAAAACRRRSPPPLARPTSGRAALPFASGVFG
jgi:hypothetical protein